MNPITAKIRFYGSHCLLLSIGHREGYRILQTVYGTGKNVGTHYSFTFLSISGRSGDLGLRKRVGRECGHPSKMQTKSVSTFCGNDRGHPFQSEGTRSVDTHNPSLGITDDARCGHPLFSIGIVSVQESSKSVNGDRVEWSECALANENQCLLLPGRRCSSLSSSTRWHYP
jgi:hypothetical protein